MKNIIFLVITSITISLFTSCKKDNKVEEDVISPIVNFKFNPLANGLPLLNENQRIFNSSSDTFNISKFNYYITNIKLTREDGYIFSETESYHLIKHLDAINSFSFSNLPEGNYKSIEFLIGVDSIRNVSGSQTGALAISNNMFWEWNTGYIFFKLEGYYTSPLQTQKNGYAIHVGGFKGVYSCLQKCKFNLNEMILAKNNHQTTVSINVSIDEIFISPKKIGFDYYYANIAQGEKIFNEISINYKDMFSISKIEN